MPRGGKREGAGRKAKATTEIKRTVGRPNQYDPSVCDQVESLMAEGFSLGAVAGSIGIARSTLALWEKANQELSDAISRGRSKAQLFWEKQLHRVAERGGGPGTSTAVMFGLKNRSPEDWADKVQHEHSGPDGGPIQGAVSISIVPIPAGIFFDAQGSLVKDEGAPE